MDKIRKFLQKLPPKERDVLLGLLQNLIAGELKGLDIKKLAHPDELRRCRKGDIRIIFQKREGKIVLMDINYRGNAYKDL